MAKTESHTGKRGFKNRPPKREREDRGEKKTSRFWLPAPRGREEQKEVEIIFLDDEPYWVTEHQFKLNGRWTNWATCLEGVEEYCPFCDVLRERKEKAKKAGRKPKYPPIGFADTKGALSIVNLTGFTNDEGEEISGYRQLIVCKDDEVTKLEKLHERKGGLVGALFVVARTGKKKPTIGNFWDYQEKWSEKDMDKEIEEDHRDPFDYDEVFAPLSLEDMEELVKDVLGEEEVELEDEKPRRRGRRSRGDDDGGKPRRRSHSKDDDEEEEEKPRRRSRRSRGDDDEEEEEKPRRRSRKTKDDEEEEKPRRRGRRSRGDDDEEEEEKPRRSRRRSRDEDEDEDDGDDEDPPEDNEDEIPF